MIKVGILTVSDTRNKDNDYSGKKIKTILSKKKEFDVIAYDIVIDDVDKIKNKLIYYVEKEKIDLILTTGGTGFSKRDVTVEATKSIIKKEVPGISEYIRLYGAKKKKTAILSRAISGICKETLIINLPGSVNGVKESLELVQDIILHAIDMIKGKGH